MTSARISASSHLGPTADEIGRQVERILASDEFHAAQRGRNFLEFVVNETLAGRSDFLKAFTIANIVFGREASFDPQNDPVVRVEAGRIRKALERYYLVAGQTDDVIITVPKGGYVPHFEYARTDLVLRPTVNAKKSPIAEPDRKLLPRETRRPLQANAFRFGTAVAVLLALCVIALVSALSLQQYISAQQAPTSASGPKVAVEFFAEGGLDDPGSDITRGLRDDIISQLAKFDKIVVVATPLRGELAGNADFTLQGNVQLDGSRLRAAARLVRQSDGVVIWAHNFDADLNIRDKLMIQGEVARQIAGAVAQPYGAIFQTRAERPSDKGKHNAYPCTLAYYSYRQTMSAQSHSVARECLQQATQNFPGSAVSWALLSLVYVDEIRFRYKLGLPSSDQSPPDHSLQLAEAAVEHAVRLSPDDPRTLQALMMVSFFKGDIDQALKAGTTAYAANPDDVEVAGEYGFRLAMSGKWQSGCELLSIALSRDTGPRGYYEAGMALCAFMKGDIETAEQWSRRSDLDANPMHHLVLLSILGAAAKMDEARVEQHWLADHAPALLASIREEISLRLQRREDQERFLNGLRASGLVIDPPQR